MNDKVHVVSQKTEYDGYLQLRQYTFELSNPNPNQSSPICQSREVVVTSDSVHVLLYAPKIDSFVFCEEFRPGVFANAADENPFLFQCVAGTIEEGETPEETARKEVYEETGMSADRLLSITQVYKSPGMLSEKSHLFYSEVEEIPQPGIYGVDDEVIKTHIISKKKAFELIENATIRDGATLLALYWFQLHRGLR
ncbi:NUDIX domain-containing protein [Legionella yabuuchiae]|uniref:NUDIX domain-containing protein n=1 Tax=Legionella yabuuchiae TaxID=376727 RepID=UPI0010569FF1|nr:NUDIX domain-containing protein [Legionella yabuuchiae]